MDGLNVKFTAPSPDEIEVTLIGGTAGYGESILIHIGNGDWVIVDSCINAKNGECAPLAYLQDFGVDLKQHLLYVICTHWHEDHIKGLSKIIEECSSKTVLAISCSDDREKFVYELLQDYDYQGRSTKLKELTQTLEQANSKSIKVQRLRQNDYIFNIGSVQAYALSPSEKVVRRFEEELATAQRKYHKALGQLVKLKSLDDSNIEDAANIEREAIEGFENLIEDAIDETTIKGEVDGLLQYKDIKKIEPNDRCVTMQISFNNHHIILGADLENNNEPTRVMGWMEVAESPSLKGVMSSLFKIPHHGSDTGYSEYFLNTFIKPDAVMKLTAWTKGDKIVPDKDMLKNYFAHSQQLYVSTTTMFKKGNKEGDVSIRKNMDNTTEAIFELCPTLGIIRSRMKINSAVDVWQTEYFGSAEKITSSHFE